MSKRTVAFTPFVTQEMKDAASRVIDSGHYIRTSPTEASEGKALEEEFSAFLAEGGGRRPHIANLANGTAAMHLAWVAYGLQPGDEVLIPGNTFVSVAHCVSLVGAMPIPVDVEPDTYNMDPQAAAAAITPRTRAIMPVHTAGHPADLDPLLALAGKHGLFAHRRRVPSHRRALQGAECGNGWGAGMLQLRAKQGDDMRRRGRRGRLL